MKKVVCAVVGLMFFVLFQNIFSEYLFEQKEPQLLLKMWLCFSGMISSIGYVIVSWQLNKKADYTNALMVSVVAIGVSYWIVTERANTFVRETYCEEKGFCVLLNHKIFKVDQSKTIFVGRSDCTDSIIKCNESLSIQ